MDKITAEQLEEILERVEDGMTTGDDADVLRDILKGFLNTERSCSCWTSKSGKFHMTCPSCVELAKNQQV